MWRYVMYKDFYDSIVYGDKNQSNINIYCLLIENLKNTYGRCM